MPRLILPAALAVLVAVPALAQSDLSTSSFALGASGTYAGAVSTSSFVDLDELRAPGVSLDATYGRFSAGAGLSFYEYDTPVELAAGFHIVRRPQEQLATTVGVNVSLTYGGGTFVTPSLGHMRRVYGSPGFALVPGATVGLAIGTEGGNALQPVAAAQLGVVLGRGPTRAVISPSVGWAGGGTQSVVVGVSAGLLRGFGR